MSVPYRVRRRKGKGAPCITRRGVPLSELKEVVGTDIRGLIYYEPPPSLKGTPYFQELTCDGVYQVLVAATRDSDALKDTLYEEELLLERNGKWTRYTIVHSIFRPNAYRDLQLLVVS